MEDGWQVIPLHTGLKYYSSLIEHLAMCGYRILGENIVVVGGL